MKWWWAYCNDLNGKPFILGPYSNDVQASFAVKRANLRLIKLYELDTKDDASASRKIKEQRGETNGYSRV